MVSSVFEDRRTTEHEVSWTSVFLGDWRRDMAVHMKHQTCTDYYYCENFAFFSLQETTWAVRYMLKD
ncbi:hypothetical protein KP509_07G034700 [Ceratopteris richardii]|uniref:Uncharacterized protein n=1 Tax=Ceratopteris richardii TaxID=49495 RepID=A0A8T2UFP6_CERRI|nr:hypothetical protein KP509_07G034700 [Ceratopteris richardii]